MGGAGEYIRLLRGAPRDDTAWTGDEEEVKQETRRTKNETRGATLRKCRHAGCGRGKAAASGRPEIM
jgi:hypothetical protein